MWQGLCVTMESYLQDPLGKQRDMSSLLIGETLHLQYHWCKSKSSYNIDVLKLLAAVTLIHKP